jgi:hypothetical protein
MTKKKVWCIVKDGKVEEWPPFCPVVYSRRIEADRRCRSWSGLILTPGRYEVRPYWLVETK